MVARGLDRRNTTKALRTLALAALVALAAAGSASGADEYPTDCGRFGQSGRVESKNVRCTVARRAVSKYTSKPYVVNVYYPINRFQCVGNLYGRKLDVFCTRRKGRQLVHYRGRTHVGRE